MVAIMAQTVSIDARAGLARGALAAGSHGCASAAMLGPRRAASASVRCRAGVDVDSDAHAGAQVGQVLAGVERDAHRHALDDLDPVAAGVLRRQDRELRAGAGADRSDRAVECWSGKVST